MYLSKTWLQSFIRILTKETIILQIVFSKKKRYIKQVLVLATFILITCIYKKDEILDYILYIYNLIYF